MRSDAKNGGYWLFLKHKNNEFNGWFSWVLIVGARLFGLADLMIHTFLSL